MFPKKAEKEEGGDEPVEPAAAGKVSNLFADFEILQWAGVSFGEEETFRIQSSLTKLSISSGSDKIRFWGKIYGTKADYYIAEGFVPAAGGEEDADNKPKGFEDRGSGINQNVYWVANSPLGEWTILPDISPLQMKASREIKVRFTGDLETQIITNPFFFGQEKHYLRAQIARITHSTTIIPRGLFKLTEDNPKEIEPVEAPEDESKAYVPSAETQCKLDNWVHSLKSILKWNRVAHMDPDPEEFGDMEPEAIAAILDKRDPTEPRLKQINQDKSTSGEDTAWTVRLLGDQSRTPGIKGKSSHYGVVVVKSLVWTGSITCWKQGKQLQFYLGDGLKSEIVSYYPIYPPSIPEDPEDLEENPEPTPQQVFEE